MGRVCVERAGNDRNTAGQHADESVGDGGIAGTLLIFFYRPSLNLRLSLDYEHFNDISENVNDLAHITFSYNGLQTSVRFTGYFFPAG